MLLLHLTFIVGVVSGLPLGIALTPWIIGEKKWNTAKRGISVPSLSLTGIGNTAAGGALKPRP